MKRVRVTYACRDIGYGIEEGEFEGVADIAEYDPWGKVTFYADDGTTLYLFPDEFEAEEIAP